MPMAGTTELLHWPPFTASPLADGRLWEYIDWGEIVDIGLAPYLPHEPLISRLTDEKGFRLAGSNKFAEASGALDEAAAHALNDIDQVVAGGP